MLSINAAKYRAMKRLDLSGDNPKVLKFVGYYSEQCHPGAERALRLKDIFHRRVVPCTYNPKIMNFELDIEAFATILNDDISKGLIPLWFGLTYGTTFSAAIELSEEVV
jgi:glutamate/tyrosine decarboxylase-like PLP-dependent enzyme